MRFKLIFFSLLALGVSCPGFASNIYAPDRNYEQEIMRAQVQ